VRESPLAIRTYFKIHPQFNYSDYFIQGVYRFRQQVSHYQFFLMGHYILGVYIAITAIGFFKIRRSLSLYWVIMLVFFIFPIHATQNQLIIKINPQNITDVPELAATLVELGLSEIKKIQHPSQSQRRSLNLSVSDHENHHSEITLIADIDNQTADHQKMISRLITNTAIDYIEKVYPLRLFSDLNDPLYEQQDYMMELSLNQLVSLPNNKTIIVAVIDSGVDYNHEDLRDSIYINQQEEPSNGIDDDNNGYIDDRYGYSFSGISSGNGSPLVTDDLGHGTHIASIIAAKPNNRIGISGVSRGVKVLPIRIFDDQGNGNQVDAAAAIRYAVDQGADIINCSWGFFQVNTILKEAVQYALNKGVIVVAAAGNANSYIPEYPASLDGVITIGSVGSNGQKSTFSSYGDHIDFMIRGQQILAAVPGNAYDYQSGTSQSTAIVSGIIGALLSARPELTGDDIYHYLQQSTESDSKTNSHGYGVININSLFSVSQLNDLAPVFQTNIDFKVREVYNYPNPIRSNQTQFRIDTNQPEFNAQIQIFTPEGQRVTTLYDRGYSGFVDITWQLESSISNGTYIYVVTLTSNNGTKVSQIEKCTVMR